MRQEGPLSCARFMELALYHPAWGYYHQVRPQTGRAGDFYTSVSAGPVFAQLLGFDFSHRLVTREGASPLILEAGAHDGQFALDLLDYFSTHQPALYERLRYLVLEPSPMRASQQAQRLAAHRPRVEWHPDWASVGSFQGICFSNELLDALPVHSFRWNARERIWVEWGAELTDGKFDWQPLSSARTDASARELLPEITAELAQVLPDGFTIESAPAARNWWHEAARRLVQGALVTIDYGLLDGEWLHPSRAEGTLRSYARHQLSKQVFETPGERDLTAHVNFPLVMAAGEAAGLRTECLARQSVYLTRIVERTHRQPDAFPDWTPSRIRQLSTLTHPEHLGRAFRVLVQTRA